MDLELNVEERQQLEAIANARKTGEAFVPDARIVAALTRKGVVRTKDGNVVLTEAGLRELKNGPA